MTERSRRDESSSELERLRSENAHLLDELEMAYLQMERVLASADHETRVAYEELRNRNEELQRRLDELEETNAQLQEAQRMLLHAERMSAMGEMAAAIVHEINAPLAVITGQVELLLMREPEAPLRDNLNTVLQAAWRLRDLAQNILRFSRQRQAETASLDLDELVFDVLQFLDPLMDPVAVDCDLAEDLPPVEVNASQIEQVLVNLVRNALDATDGRRDARIHLSTGTAVLADLVAQEEERGWRTRLALDPGEGEMNASWLYVEVRDNGRGIAEGELREIFEAFYTTKEEGRGTGLGLAISRGIVEAHGGNLLVASRREAGTSFRILLPLETRNGRKQ